MRLIFAFFFSALLVIANPARATVDLDALARTAAGDARTPTEKITAVVAWTHRALEWTGTDYRSRSVTEIIERGGGNCNEQASVVRALLTRLGVQTRRIREINIQPPSTRRAQNARDMIGRQGSRASVFGFQHNDHVWIEYFDEQTREWLPADPTLNLIGRESWSRARLGFGARPVHDILPSRDMLVPIAVLAETGDAARPFEDRTRHYLVNGFAAHVPEARQRGQWSSWVQQITALNPLVVAAFDGRHNLHEDNEAIDRLRRTYEAMRAGP